LTRSTFSPTWVFDKVAPEKLDGQGAEIDVFANAVAVAAFEKVARVDLGAYLLQGKWYRYLLNFNLVWQWLPPAKHP
jgi:hypothetical protein